MNPDVVKIFAGMMAVIIPLSFGATVFTLARRFWRRPKAPASIPSEQVEELRARLAELEYQADRAQALEERLDFLERMIPALRERKPVREITPV